MSISTWLIIGVIVFFVYRLTKCEESATHNGYRLDISIEPNWYKLYKRLCNPMSEEELDKSLNEKFKKLKDDGGASSLWGRSYHFTEYYDSSSGLTTRESSPFLVEIPGMTITPLS